MSRVVALVVVALAACKGANKQQPPATGSAAGSGSAAPAPVQKEAEAGHDPHSDARIAHHVVKHLDLDLTVDFDTRVLTGIAKLTFERRDQRAGIPLRLDVGSLAITKVVECAAPATSVPFGFEPSTNASQPGQTLTVQTQGTCVAVHYQTPKEALALLWLEPELTAGKKQPMLFTQSQPTLARTWIPLQDTPSVRFTYDATVRVKPGLVAVMSATNPMKPVADGVYTFQMDKPIPSYLMALAVGDFAFKAIGARTGVYAEPSVLAAAAYEFGEVDQMMAAAEKLYGPYRWDRYDVLVLPPSFPFGGMENPKLSFLTPTVLTGDRALVSLLAHELAHSWSGNLVTNSTWNDVWLNEGFTTYVERRIMEELRGKDVADIGWALGRMDLDDVTADPKLDTRLALTYKRGEDPEGAPSDIAYEKGALLLRAMEQAFGRDAFDAFLKARFDRLAFQSTDSATFERDAAELFAAKDPGWKLADWLHGRGIPASAPSSESARVVDLKKQAAALAGDGTLPDASKWTSLDWVAYLRSIPRTVTHDQLVALDKKYALTKTPNAMIAMRWYPLAIAADMQEAAPVVEEFLVRVGRRWLVRTVYEAMVNKGGFWKELADKSFARAKGGYHSMTRETIAKMLEGKPIPPP